MSVGQRHFLHGDATAESADAVGALHGNATAESAGTVGALHGDRAAERADATGGFAGDLGLAAVAAVEPEQRDRIASRLRIALPPLAVLVALLGAWELCVDLGAVNPALLAAPHTVASDAWQNAGLLWHNTLVTLKEVVLGLGLAVLAGFLLAIGIHFSTVVRRSVYPLAVGSQALPIVTLAPMLAFWLGFGLLPKLLVITLICFFPVTVTTVDGLGAADDEQLKLLRTLDASRWQAFRFAELPAALPRVLTGARIALVVAWIAAFIAETTTPTIGPYAGLGREIVTDFNNFNDARADAATVILFVCAVACFYALSLAERRVARWARTKPGDQT